MSLANHPDTDRANHPDTDRANYPDSDRANYPDSDRKLIRVVKLCGSKLRSFADDSGSIAVIVIGLFVITVASLMVMTNVSTVIVAKRSLAQATEAAAQRGVHSLDKASYYQGKANIFTVPMAIATHRAHPTIPIDCNRGGLEVLLELHSWSNDDSDLKWHQLKGIQLTDYQCDGQSLSIETRSEVNLPFTVPFTAIDSVFLTATAGTINQVQEGFYLFGIRLH
jgi:hypothetical protein